MATKAQIAANRRNSKKSTGPRTAEGKEAVSENAFKHGLFVKKDVVRDESQDEYDLHREAMEAELAPDGPVEAFLVQRIVRLSWRLVRAERMQNNSFDYLAMEELCGRRGQHFRTVYLNSNQIWDDLPEIPREHLLLGRLAVNDFTNYRVLEKMQLYERRLDNSLHKTRAELEKLQARRRARQKARQQSAPVDDQANLKKQSQSPAFGGKSEALNPKHALSNVDGSETIGSCAVDLKKQSQSTASGGKSETLNSKPETGPTTNLTDNLDELKKQSQFEAPAHAGRSPEEQESLGASAR